MDIKFNYLESSFIKLIEVLSDGHIVKAPTPDYILKHVQLAVQFLNSLRKTET